MADANRDVKLAAAGAGVKLWQIAEALGISCDSNFSRKLRRELSDEEKAQIFKIINRLASTERGNV